MGAGLRGTSVDRNACKTKVFREVIEQFTTSYFDVFYGELKTLENFT